MKVLSVASEVYPLIKTGGLADVAGALPAALAAYGVDMQVLLPGYKQVMAKLRNPVRMLEFSDLFGATASILACRIDGLQYLVLDAPHLYDRDGGPYTDAAGADHPDNWRRFAALSRAAATIAEDGLERWVPDIVHAHDWQAGLVPVYLRHGKAAVTPTVMTVHNLAFQGLFAADALPLLGLPGDTFSPEGVEFYGRISFLKAGLRYADRLTTVSRTYAREIQTPEFGCGLDGLLRQRSRHLLGIPNGADYGLWDPAEDSSLPRRYSLAEIGRKRDCKAVLQCELGLDVEPETPLFAFLSRLTEQKMADTVAEAVPWLIAAGAQFALHGQGDRALEERFKALAEQYPGRVSVQVGYEERSARRLLAGADVLLHPSRFEPFGLVPIYALRYGTLPRVRKVGGLADSVVDGSTSNVDGEATGFAFSGDTLEDLLGCLRRALDTFGQPVAWRRMQRHAMRQDFGWRGPAEEYLDLYRTLTESRAEQDFAEPGPGRGLWSDRSFLPSPPPMRARTAKG